MRKEVPREVRELIISSWKRRHEEGNSQHKIAKKYNLNRSTVQAIIRRYQLTGAIENKSGRGRKHMLTSKEAEILNNEVKANPLESFRTLAARVKSITGKKVTPKTVSNYLRRQDVPIPTRKKSTVSTKDKKYEMSSTLIRNCLFCTASCSKKEETILKDDFPGAVNCLLLKIQLQKYFILQKILEVEKPSCEDILKGMSPDFNLGFPVKVCDGCLEVVEAAWKVYQKIVALQVEFDLYKQKLKEKMKTTVKIEGSHSGVEGRIRTAVVGDLKIDLIQTNDKCPKEEDIGIADDRALVIDGVKEEIFDTEFEDTWTEAGYSLSSEDNHFPLIEADDRINSHDDSGLDMEKEVRRVSERSHADAVKGEFQALAYHNVSDNDRDDTENESKLASDDGKMENSNPVHISVLKTKSFLRNQKRTRRNCKDNDFLYQPKQMLSMRSKRKCKTYKFKSNLPSTRPHSSSIKVTGKKRGKYRKKLKPLLPGNEVRISDDLRYKCHLCGVRFETDDALKNHLDLHLQRESCQDDAHLNCNLCSFPAVDLVELESHKSSSHIPKPWHCPAVGCNFRGRLHCILDRHVLKEHSILNEDEISKDPAKMKAFFAFQIKCSNCLKKFSKPRSLLDHWKLKVCERREKPSKYICEDCGAVFEKLVTFSSHRSRKHPRTQKELEMLNRTFVCHICGMDYTENLKRHYQKHHEGKEGGSEESNVKQPEVIHKCDYCDVTSPLLIVIRRHEQVHLRSGEGGYKCGQCERGYRSDMALKRHIRINHPKKKLDVPCPHCGKVFAAKDYLRAHITVHCPKVKAIKDAEPVHIFDEV